MTDDFSDNKAFERVEIVDKTEKVIDLDELHNFIKYRMSEIDSMLCIVNTRAAALKIYNLLVQSENNFEVYHLSNNMIPAHRRQVLDKIKAKLKSNDTRIFVISTQLIEAGVDISFQEVVRSVAGLDSIAQAAGRCNRSGEFEKGSLYIVELHKELESIDRIKEIKAAKETMLALLSDFRDNPEKFENRLLGDLSLEFYFEQYYLELGEVTRFVLEDDTTIFDLLSNNKKGVEKYIYENNVKPKHLINQAFKTAGFKYKPIDDLTKTILIPWGKGEKLISELNTQEGIYKRKQLLKEAGIYSLQIFKYKFDDLVDKQLIYFLQDDIPALRPGYYTDIGLNSESVCKIETITF